MNEIDYTTQVPCVHQRFDSKTATKPNEDRGVKKFTLIQQS